MKDNTCKKINLDEWDRAELFNEFINMTTSIYDMTVHVVPRGELSCETLESHLIRAMQGKDS